MAEITYFVVLAFDRSGKGRMVAREPYAPPTAEGARPLAEKLSASAAGAIAFSRTGDPDLGDWRDAEVLAAFGALPEELGLPMPEPWEEGAETA